MIVNLYTAGLSNSVASYISIIKNFLCSSMCLVFLYNHILKDKRTNVHMRQCVQKLCRIVENMDMRELCDIACVSCTLLTHGTAVG